MQPAVCTLSFPVKSDLERGKKRLTEGVAKITSKTYLQPRLCVGLLRYCGMWHEWCDEMLYTVAVPNYSTTIER